MVIVSWLSLFQLAAIVPMQDELDDILRYGAAELFADAAAANQQAQQVGSGAVKGAPPFLYVCICAVPYKGSTKVSSICMLIKQHGRHLTLN